jgi:hypothetical protein
MVLPPAHNYYIGCGATIAPNGLLLWISAVIYRKIFILNITSIDSRTKEKISLAPTPFSDETSLLYYLWSNVAYSINITCFRFQREQTVIIAFSYDKLYLKYFSVCGQTWQYCTYSIQYWHHVFPVSKRAKSDHCIFLWQVVFKKLLCMRSNVAYCIATTCFRFLKKQKNDNWFSNDKAVLYIGC